MKVGSGMFEPDLYQFSFIHDDRVSTLKRSREKERVTPISDSFLRKLQIDTICYETLYLPRVSHTHTHTHTHAHTHVCTRRANSRRLELDAASCTTGEIGLPSTPMASSASSYLP